MPRKRIPPPPISGTEQRLLSALDRLRHKQPQNLDLKAKAVRGCLRITISTVAAEAGLSRTLIGHKGCQYPRVRAAIIAEQNAAPAPRNETEARLSQARQIAALKHDVKVRDSALAAYCRRLHKIRKETDQEVARAERVAARKQRLPDPNVIAGAKLTAVPTTRGRVGGPTAAPGSASPRRRQRGT